MNMTYIVKRKNIIRIGVLVACMLFTIVYGILIFNACKQREQAWSRQAKAVFLEAVGNELNKLDKMEIYGFHTVTSLFQQKTLETDIPDSVVFASQEELMFIIFLYTGGITLILKMEIRIFISA